VPTTTTTANSTLASGLGLQVDEEKLVSKHAKRRQKKK
jgi:hypothetical protein